MDGRQWRHLASGAGLLLLLWVFPGAHTSLCKSVFSPISGDMPKDFSLKVGDPLVLNCTLETPEFSISSRRYSVNGSHLEIKFNDTKVPGELLSVGEMWVALRKERSEYSDTGNYNCNIRVATDKVFHVCATQVTIGEPPLPVENFRCISYYYKNLTCYWEPPPNSVKTEYRLGEMFAYTRTHKGFYRLCPKAGHSGNGSYCSWTLGSSPPLRKETTLFRLVMNGTNALGVRNFTYTIEHLKIVKISEPTEFKCSAVSKRSVTLSWNASIEQRENPKLLVIYEIHYQSQYESNWKTVEVFNKTSLMIQNLNPFTAYTFRLRGKASKAVREELWTDDVVLSQTTLKDVPEAPPRISRSGFKVQNYQHRRTIMLNFEALPEKKWGGATLQYLIKCCEEDVPEDSCENKTVEMPTVMFEGLFRNSRYNFQLWSLNEIGFSRVHSSLQVDKYDELINVPQDIEVVAHGSGSYVVSWRAPSARVPVLTSSTSISAEEEHAASSELGPVSYTVFWCPRMLPRSYSCNESLKWQKTELNTSSIVLNLDAGNVYQFAVAAQTVDKASEMHWTTCVIPVSKELEKITQVTLEKDSAHSLLMHWQLECSALKSYVNSYQIEACAVLPRHQKMALHDAAGCLYSKYDPKTCRVYNITDRDDEEHVLDGLSSNAVYRAVVRASSNGKLTEDSPAQCAKTEGTGADIPLVVGCAVGGAVGLTVLVFVLYLLARWMKKKVDMIKEIKIQLPDGLDSSEANQMHSYKNSKNGSAGKTSESNRSPHIAYGRMGCFSAADNAGPKKRHDSGRSQGSSSSTEELLYKKTRRADTFGRNPSGDSSGGSTNGQDSVVSASTARTGAASSCDSGAESDPAAPPSPDCLLLGGNHTPLARCRPNLPKLDEDRVRESQDSGLDAEVTPPIVIPSSDSSQPSYSKLGVTPDTQAPLLQSQALATSEPSLFEGPENVPELVEPLPPYSKFGLARSSEDVSVAPYTACRSSPDTRRQDGPPALPYSQLALRQQPSVNGVPGHVFPSTDVTVGLALEQPRFLPNLKSTPLPFFPKPPSSGYVTVGQAMKTQPTAVEPQSGQGYSKFGIQPPKPLTRPDTSGYVPLQDVVGVHQAAVPATTMPAGEPSPHEHFRDVDSSSDDMAIVGDDNSNNASLEDFSFSSASGPGTDELVEAHQSPQRTARQTPGYVAATVVPATKPPPLDLTSEPRIASNGYVPLPSVSPGETQGGAGDYVTHVAAFDWGRSAPGDGEMDDSALPPPTSAAKTNGYVMLPTTVDAVNSRTSAVGFVPGVKPESSSQVDCSV
ncbi:cytokine receptor domeless [Dermacentor variabilis]|uniref:cytokine receptor domeless n=1 Tax=Dermacentor variabilis TaxID=34621 RepID=UPI003F5CB2A0